ncbi:P-loop containing nucleoside triphosphate hydrolase protein [Cladochytrium replicatum]|nr:P-loop containing nucleoside triphosphate hydrolase protein [Cladochytrium replicatum]
MSKAPPKVRRIAVLGSRAVGKSSLTVQFVENHFAETYYPTIENTFTKILKIRNQEYAAEIIDTAGHDEYSILNSKHVIGIHGYVLVYSITSRPSFEMCKVIRDKILNYTGIDWVPIVIVGNKCDLEAQRQVQTEEAAALAQEWKCSHIEASAKHNQNITKTFELVLMEIEKQSAENIEQPKPCSIM